MKLELFFFILLSIYVISSTFGTEILKGLENNNCDMYQKADCVINYAICKRDATKNREVCECIKEMIICLESANCYDNDEKEYYQKLCKKYGCNFCVKYGKMGIYMHFFNLWNKKKNEGK